jgi:hypothetical protein
MNNNNLNFISLNEAKEIITDETQKMIFALNRTFPNDLKNEKLDLIALIESLERRIIKEIYTNTDKKFFNDIFNSN